MKLSVIFALLSITLCSCQYMDDQTIISKDREKFGNPSPVSRNFKQINEQHKVLVAVIDTGIDYNHPYLIQNLHFKLDQKSNPVGYGYDVSGEDEWAAPYIVRTSDYNEEIDKNENQKSIEQIEAIQSLLAIAPDLHGVLNPARNVSQEQMGAAYHGTHVAGLASYDAPEIGILGYRILPFSLKFKDGVPVQKDVSDLLVNQIIESSERAIADGARVINMSLGQLIEKKHSNPKEDSTAKTKHLERVHKIQELALNNPDTAFVVAAGNDGKWIDQNARVGLPCGADAPNIICVGAVDSDGDIASFSNILMAEGTFVLGYGVNVLSTMPQDMCSADEITKLQDGDEVATLSKDKKIELVEKIRNNCQDLLLEKLSGTSMATPIIAREIAKILSKNPSLSAKGAIQQMINESDSYNMGKISFPRLKIKKPSWAKEESTLSLRSGYNSFDDGFNSDVEEDDFFEFVIPQSYSK